MNAYEHDMAVVLSYATTLHELPEWVNEVDMKFDDSYSGSIEKGMIEISWTEPPTDERSYPSRHVFFRAPMCWPLPEVPS